MTSVFIDLEIVRAIGLSIVFMGVILGIVTMGVSFLLYRISKTKGKQYLKMAGLVFAWSIFIALNSQSSSLVSYSPAWLVYSIAHLVSIFLGFAILLVFFSMLSKMNKVFDKNILMVGVIAAILSVLMRVIFPFFANPYLSLVQRVVIIIPSLIGLFVIIKSYIEEKS